MFKNHVQKKLEKYVVKYFAKHPEVKLVAVTGSVGKTSTKVAIATVLSQQYRVRLHEGNHNTNVSAPLAILGIDYPGNIKSIGAWRSVFRAAKKRIKDPADTDIIIQELGVDRPGDMAQFSRYLRPDIAVVTAVTPEHMEFLQTIETVAQEELGVANFSKLVLINHDDIDGRFADLITNPSLDTYGTTAAAEYRFEIQDFTLEAGYTGALIAPEFPDQVPAKVHLVGEHSLRTALAAAAVAVKLGMQPQTISSGLEKIHAVPGRMNILRGLQQSLMIDDTYNSSPAAVSAAMQVLYSIEAPQRIALLGSMNELGAVSAEEHKKIGDMCDPNLLAWVVTVGTEAGQYLAPAAKARGCQVKVCQTALEAGAFVHSVLEDNAVILAKGSQGGIFLEEAVKILVHYYDEDIQLVRQSPEWLATKNDFFAKFPA